MPKKNLESVISLIFGIITGCAGVVGLAVLFGSNLLNSGGPAVGAGAGPIVFLILIVPALMLCFLSFMCIGYFVYGQSPKE